MIYHEPSSSSALGRLQKCGYLNSGSQDRPVRFRHHRREKG